MFFLMQMWHVPVHFFKVILVWTAFVHAAHLLTCAHPCELCDLMPQVPSQDLQRKPSLPQQKQRPLHWQMGLHFQQRLS